MDLSLLISPENLALIKQQLGEHQPMWLIALAALIPFCILLFLREIACWFWKVNQINSNLRKIERHLRTQVEFIEQRRPVPEKKNPLEQVNNGGTGSRVTQREN